MVTLRDHTELRALVSELKTIRGFAEALSAQAHESANQLQTVISLIELGRADEALRFAATELAVAQHLTDIVVGAVGEPELAALVLGKAAEASERGVELRVDDDLEVPAGVADPRDLVTIVGNLLDNAVDAATEAPAPRWVRLEAGVLTVDGVEELELAVADSGPGLGPTRRRTRSTAAGRPRRRTARWAAASAWPWWPKPATGSAARSRSRTRSARRSPCAGPGAALRLRRSIGVSVRRRSRPDRRRCPGLCTKPVMPASPVWTRTLRRLTLSRLPSSCRTQASGLLSSA